MISTYDILEVIIKILLLLEVYYGVGLLLAGILQFVALRIVKKIAGETLKTQIGMELYLKSLVIAILSYVISVYTTVIICAFEASMFSIEYIICAPFFFARISLTESGYMLYFSFSVILSAVIIFIGNYLFALRKIDFSKKKRLISALIITFMTAPYWFYVSFYNVMISFV